ncbi:18092_t:CDS:2, partial [Acaulospora morrowiae]
GDLEEMVQINYMVDIEYLISQLPQLKRHSLHTTIVHDLHDENRGTTLSEHKDDVCGHAYNLRNKSQGIYMTPILSRKRNDSSSCEFKTDLQNYFKSYSNNTMKKYDERLKNYDFSSVKAVLIASVPGYHTKDSLLK